MRLPTYRLWKRALMLLFIPMLSATGGCRQGPWSLWQAYSLKFIDNQGRVIDPQGDARTTSEGQCYALFFALVSNDRGRFDQVLNWTRNNLAQGDLDKHLPSWLWGRNKNGEWKTIDANSASDSDVWLAYTLYEAGRLWKQPVYTQTSRQVMAQIAHTEVADLPGFGTMLLPGPSGFQHGDTSTLNPSYLPLFIFNRLAGVDRSGPWQRIAANIPRLIEESSRKGFAMDWVNYVPGGGFYPAPEHPGDSDAKDSAGPGGSYDAIRVYMWAGMLGSGPARAAVLNSLPSMSVYLASHDAPPEKISDQGAPNGKDGSVGFSAALIPYLKCLPGSEKAASQQLGRVNAQKDAATGLYGTELTYYDQNLALFATGFLDGRFRFGPGGELKVEWTRS